MRVFLFFLIAFLPLVLGLAGFILCFNLIADLLLGSDRGFWGTLLISPICLILGTFLFSSLWAFVIAPIVGFFASMLARFGIVPANGVYFRSISVSSSSLRPDGDFNGPGVNGRDIIDVTPLRPEPQKEIER